MQSYRWPMGISANHRWRWNTPLRPISCATGQQRKRVSKSYDYFIAIGELDKDIQTYQLMAAAYPNNPMSYANLGADYSMLGQNDKARMEFEKALLWLPTWSTSIPVWRRVIFFWTVWTMPGKTINAALARKLDDGGLRQFLYYLAFLAGDNAKMEQQLTWAVGKPGDEDALLSLQSDTEAYYGRMKKARPEAGDPGKLRSDRPLASSPNKINRTSLRKACL